MTTTWGIDSSSHNPVQDIDALKAAGIEFNIIKRTGGTQYINPYGRAQVALHRGAGILVWHYLYFGEVGLTTGKGADEAAWFIKEVGDDLREGELPVVDWEEEGASDIEELLACLEALEARYGVIPGIYSYPDFLARHVPQGDTRLARYPLFFASYRSSYPPCPPPWSKIVVWQYSDNENIPGVGHVDGDRFEGTIEELKAYGKPGKVSAAVVPGSVTEVGNATGEDVRPYIDEQGRVHVDICFGGVATKVLGVNSVDTGVSVIGDDGAVYDRTIRANVFEPWQKRAG